MSNYVYTSLNDPAAYYTIANGINDRGQIVGWYKTSDMNQYYGFVYSGGKYTALDEPLAGSSLAFIYAQGINDKGQVVGLYRDVSETIHGFLYSNDKYTTIDVPLASKTVAYGINNKGQIVGSYNDNSGSRRQIHDHR